VRRIQIDTYVGMAVSNLIGFFIILTCAATLHSAGIKNIESASDHRVMGDLVIPLPLKVAGWICAGIMSASVLGLFMALRG
jgi:Mn2+/Fe2+ NRAMP family transporter